MRLVLCLMLLLSAVSCVSPELDAAYVDADRATFEAITPSYTAYVDGDTALDEAAKARRLKLVESWKNRIEAAEGVQ